MKAFVRAVRNFFGTTRAQTNGFIVVLFILTISIFSQPVTRWWISSRPQDFSQEKAVLDSLVSAWETEKELSDSIGTLFAETKPIQYFKFNPNTATKDELASLGFPAKLVLRMVNYRAKGGTFRLKKDLLKIYGMDSVFYSRVAPYILLPDKIEYPVTENKKPGKLNYPAKEKAARFNLNEADTLHLQKVYGIGPVLANRIIRYRDKLGGFITHAQLREVYGLDTAVVQNLAEASYLPEPASVQKINLNTANEETLAAHPYFTKNIARAIVSYRFQHGKFQSVQDLTHINLIDKRTLAKVSPYLTVDP